MSDDAPRIPSNASSTALSELARLLDADNRSGAIDLLDRQLAELARTQGFMPDFLDVLRAHGSRANALACVNTSRAILPKNIDLKLLRVDILIRLGKLDGARTALSQLSTETHRPVYWKHMLAVGIGADKLGDAADMIAQSHDGTSRDSLVLRHAEIKTLLAQNAFVAAEEKITAALQVFSNASRLHVQNVRLIMARDGARAALPLAQNVAKRFARSMHAQLLLCTCLRGAGDHNAALERLQKTADQFAQSALPQIRLARINLDLGHRFEALKHIQEARRLDAGTLPVELTYVDVLIKLGRREGAVERLEWLVGNEQITPAILAKLINSLVELRRYGPADSYVRMGMEQFPDSATLSECYVMHAKLDKLPALREVAVDVDASHMPKLRLDAMSARVALDNLDTATALSITRQKATARREPDDVIFIARALGVAARPELAWRYLRFCLRHWQSDPAIVSVLSQTANKIGRQVETISVVCTQDKEPLPQAPEILSNLVLLHAAIGASDAAFMAFRACLSAGGFPQQNAYRMLLRCMIGDGRAPKLDLLIKEQESSGLWKTPHPQKSYHGQLVTEVKIALAIGDHGPARKVGPRNRLAHVDLMKDHADSNVAAMRMLRHWLLYGPERRGKAGAQIPQQIIQYWDSAVPPPQIAQMMQTWRETPDFTHQQFNRQTATAYLRAHFDADTFKAFRLARNPAEEADFFRLCILSREGGVYADADDMRTGNLASLLPQGAAFVALLEPGFANVGNNFIAAAPRHTVLIDAANRAQGALLSRAAETTWSKTGPGLLTRALANALAQGPKKDAGRDVALLSLADISGKVAIHNAAPHKTAATDWRSR